MDQLAQISADFPLGVGVFLGVLGAVLGSFLTMATYRLPLDEPVGRTRSRCTSCGATLSARDLIPLLSWLLHKGRCRHCKTRISCRYPLIEASCAAVMVGVYALWGISGASLCLMGLLLGIVAIFITDVEHRIILDEVQIGLFFIGILYGMAMDTPLPHLFAMAAIGLAIGLALKYGFLFLMNKDGLGMGDVKFLAVAGVWLASTSPSATAFVPFLFYAGLLGIITALLWKCVSKDEHFPFGPALALSLLLCVLWPDAVAQFFVLYGVLPLSAGGGELSTGFAS